jgi:hypothetical protein
MVNVPVRYSNKSGEIPKALPKAYYLMSSSKIHRTLIK